MSAHTQSQINKLNKLYKAQNELYHKFAVHFGVADTALWVLYVIYSSETPRTQYDLAEEWCFPKQSVNSAISNLEKEGYIYLETVPGTRNRKNVILTEAGKAFCLHTVARLIEAENRAFSHFNEEERNLYITLFEKQIAYLKEETGDMINK